MATLRRPFLRAVEFGDFEGAKYELVEQFKDEGVSGTKELDARPGLAALLDRIESKGVKVVIVERADRLARDLMVSELILDQFAKVLTAGGQTEPTCRAPLMIQLAR